MQILELLILRRQAAFRGHIDDQQHLAGKGCGVVFSPSMVVTSVFRMSCCIACPQWINRFPVKVILSTVADSAPAILLPFPELSHDVTALRWPPAT